MATRMFYSQLRVPTPALPSETLGGNRVHPSHTGLVHRVVGHEAWVLVEFWHSVAHHLLSLHLTFLKMTERPLLA